MRGWEIRIFLHVIALFAAGVPQKCASKPLAWNAVHWRDELSGDERRRRGKDAALVCVGAAF